MRRSTANFALRRADVKSGDPPGVDILPQGKGDDDGFKRNATFLLKMFVLLSIPG